MSLIKCPGCGHQISSRAKCCPKCGCSSAGADQPGNGIPVTGSLPGSGAPAADAAGIAQDPPEEAPPQTLQQEAVPEWFYVAASGRTGPVTLESLQKLAADGEIVDSTQVWKAGMADWVALSRYLEAPETVVVPPAEAPAPAVKSLPKWLVWSLATAPAWGTMLQIIATEFWVALTGQRLGYYSEFWWIIVLANLAASSLDFIQTKKSGQITGLANWLFLLVPAYLYLRDRKLKTPPVRFGVWVASLALSLTACLYLNDIFARLSLR